MTKPLDRSTLKILSPLRYPGAKRRLGAYVAEFLRLNELSPKLYVEPFAGGGSVAIQLLQDGLVESIAFGEKDPMVAAFWQVAFDDTDWLIKEIRRTPITLESWLYFKQTRFRSIRQQALACLFLNRTSFSGILSSSAGPIGGKAQTSDYKINCRFNLETIIKRLEKLKLLRSGVKFISNSNWKDTMKLSRKKGFRKQDVFYYLDPPFFSKAEKLYRFYFTNGDHQELHEFLSREKSPWLLSYDPAPTIVAMYSRDGIAPNRISFLYSSDNGTELRQVEELIVTNQEKLPEETRVWRKTSEWKNKVLKSTKHKGRLPLHD